MSFLASLATTLLQTYGTDLSRVTVVFPNKRAALFLNEELIRLSDRPLWSPAYTTISDLFRTMALRQAQGPKPIEVADPIKLICDLHKSFVKCTGIEESLDHFYGWGQLLLADFDDVDKHLAPADKVFANLRDIHEFDDDTYLTQKQRDIIRKFFKNFNEDHNSELKQRFLSLWSHIYDIYLDFNARLAAQGLAYEGALYRQVIEQYSEGNTNALLNQTEGLFSPSKNIPHEGVFRGSPNFGISFDSCRVKQDKEIDMRCCLSEASSWTSQAAKPSASNDSENRTSGPGARTFFEGEDCPSPQQYVFAGFNLLLPVELALIHRLKAEDKACLIQDTDEDTPKEISIISAPTNNIQARYVSTWLQENDRIQAGRKTAIVLADESLLQSVIHCFPPEVTKVNITTGYPLSQTAAAQGMSVPLLRGQVSSFQKRPGSSFLLVRNVFERKDLPSESPLELEAQYRLYTILNRLQALIDSGDLQVSDATLQRLLTQIIASTTIPFHGEPLEGIQVMGVLETRNIDFDHVLLLSCNEGNIPKGINDTSFIPYSIRKAYGLTTVDNKVAIYENYFRRLLQRAKDVTLVYNNATNDGKTGEMSRFMLQLMVESNHPITYLTLQAGQTPKLHHPQPITKTPEVMERLKGIQLLSPSALSRYLRCPLRFFYQDICKLSEFEDLEDDLIDNRVFGNIFHKAAHILYSSLITHHLSLITSSMIQALLNHKDSIARAVDEAIKLELFHIEDPMAKMPPLNGLQLINREVIIRYIHQLLEVDCRLTPFTILALETPLNTDRSQTFSLRKHSCVPSVASEQSSSAARGTSQDVFERKDLTTINLGGIADRIDKITLPDGTERIRIIDYKTSNYHPRPLPDVAAIFNPANIRHHSDYYLQSFLYAIILDSQFSTLNSQLSTLNSPVSPVSPCLLFIQHAGTDDYDPTLILGKTPVTDISSVKDEFLHHLNLLLSEIYDDARPFAPTDDSSRCHTCPFRNICG